MLRLFTIVGARPQFIKAAAVSRAIRDHFPGQVEEKLVHTGQHYDDNMSDVFFREMEIPVPAYHLGIGSGSHGNMTGKMLAAIEQVLLEGKPDILLVYGDTNSTLAGAVAAAKLHIPVAHVEAGLRSFKKSMPEEINRRLCDHISTFLFPPTETGIRNLAAEGLSHQNNAPVSADHPLVLNAGDVMLDNALYFSAQENSTGILERAGVRGNSFILATIHRDFNTDNPARLRSIVVALLNVAETLNHTIVIPLHPRTKNILQQQEFSDLRKALEASSLIRITAPVSYTETLALLKNTSLVITDSGGLQKEAYFFRKPCVILRNETEWHEIVETGNAVCADADAETIRSASAEMISRSSAGFPELYGDGKAAAKIVRTLTENFPL